MNYIKHYGLLIEHAISEKRKPFSGEHRKTLSDAGKKRYLKNKGKENAD
jgi:hypothetical protein